MNLYEVVIVGAGIIGLNIAWQLSRRGMRNIVVLEQGAAPGEGSTGASSAVLRHRYTFDEVVHFARDGINAYRHWPDYTGLSEPSARFQADGVLWMPADDIFAPAEQKRLNQLGIAAEVLDDTDLEERFPEFNVCVRAPDVVSGTSHQCRGGALHMLETDAGCFDPTAALSDLRKACERAGVEICFNTRVVDIDHHAGAVTGVTLADSKRLAGSMVINAAGPWCNTLTQRTGIRWPWTLVPTRIQVAYVDLPKPMKLPVSVDFVGGLYFRTQNSGQQLVVGSTREEDEQETVTNPDEFDRFADEEFITSQLHALGHRLPLLAELRRRPTSYCGLYTVNRNDMHPVIGATEMSGYIVANGFSGHGFKLAPAVGALIARELTGKSDRFDTQIDFGFFGVERDPFVLEQMNVLA
jgi:glycine/D-amino acid oxidase-like deaminating enzyme